MAPVTHIVLFGFQDGATPEQRRQVGEGFLKLKEQCTKDGKHYILSVKGGVDNSPEGKQDGHSCGFIVEFANEEDRDFYVHQDAAHHAYQAYVRERKIAKVAVIDFNSGVF